MKEPSKKMEYDIIFHKTGTPGFYNLTYKYITIDLWEIGIWSNWKKISFDRAFCHFISHEIIHHILDRDINERASLLLDTKYGHADYSKNLGWGI